MNHIKHMRNYTDDALRGLCIHITRCQPCAPAHVSATMSDTRTIARHELLRRRRAEAKRKIRGAR